MSGGFASSSFKTIEAWSYGAIEAWSYGDIEAWSHGDIEACRDRATACGAVLTRTPGIEGDLSRLCALSSCEFGHDGNVCSAVP